MLISLRYAPLAGTMGASLVVNCWAINCKRRARGGPHLGLGPHIARLIAEFHGGRIAAANRGEGSGAILTLRFPLRAAAYNTGQPG
ncbi:MAG: hypothetical protein HY848_04905 [Betaproteobacteria bacterium]|nr:hypothetical protein [Betaproteobacteria bacterium]